MNSQNATTFTYFDQNLDHTYMKQLKWMIPHVLKYILSTCITNS